MSFDAEASDVAISLALSDVNRMRCELLAAELTRQQPRCRVLGQAVSAGELLKLAERGPDIIVISAALREGPLAGFDALRELRARDPGARSILLLDTCERDLVLAAFRGGARGVFCRSGSVEQLVKCVERVAQGQVWAGNTELEFLLQALSELAPLRTVPATAVLNRREQQIGALAVAGHDNRAIARKLNLAEVAVAQALRRIFDKLGITSRVELALALGQPTVRRPAASATRAGQKVNDQAV